MKQVKMWLVGVLGVLWAAHAAAEAPGREDVSLVSVTSTVESINYETRELVLRGPKDNLNHMVVSDEVKRLKEVKVGDAVTVDLFVSNLYEVREPSEEELKEPFVELEQQVVAESHAQPAGAKLKQFRSVCTIVDLNGVNMTGTLKDSRGKYHVVAIKNPENITKLRIGMSVVLTHTEALAVSLEKPTAEAPAKPTGVIMQN